MAGIFFVEGILRWEYFLAGLLCEGSKIVYEFRSLTKSEQL